MTTVRTWRGELPLPGLVARFNTWLDRLVRPTATLAGRRTSPFLLCGYAGLAVAVALSQVIIAAHGRSHLVMGLVTVTALATFLTLVTLIKLAIGREVLVYYHHELAVLGATSALLWALGQPLLAYLDAVIVGLGGFLVCGRIGCLLVGCCHGRPARVGARYRQEHSDEGFTPAYVGVRLLPVPLLEALAVTVIVVAGLAQVLADAPSGQALVFHVAAYGAVRSWLEFLRGDTGRPHLWGLSHGQWTALVLVTGVTVAVGTGALPGAAGYCGVALAVTAVAGCVAGARWRRDARSAHLLGPGHLADTTTLLQQLTDDDFDTSDTADDSSRSDETGLQVAGPTPAGLVVSMSSPVSAEFSDDTGRLHQPLGGSRHYGLSTDSDPLPPRAARGLARCLLRVAHPGVDVGHLVESKSGIHHLVVPPVPPVPTAPTVLTNPPSRAASQQRRASRDRPAGLATYN